MKRTAVVTGLAVLGVVASAALGVFGWPQYRHYRARAACEAGANHLQAHEFDDAMAALDEAIRWDAESADAYRERGECHSHLGNVDEAIADFTTAIGLEPRCAAAYCGRGTVQFAKFQLDEAFDDVTRAIKFDPACAPAYVLRAELVFRRLREHKRAIGDLEEALTLDPNSAHALLTSGFVREAMGDIDRAEENYSRCIDACGASGEPPLPLAPKPNASRSDRLALWHLKNFSPAAVAYTYRGILRMRKFQTDRAIGDFSEAIRIWPSNPDIYLNRASAFAFQSSWPQAIADYTTAIGLEPDSAAAYRLRAECQRRAGDTDKAIADCGEAIRLSPNSSELYRTRAALWNLKGDREKASDDARIAYRLAPRSGTGSPTEKLASTGRASIASPQLSSPTGTADPTAAAKQRFDQFLNAPATGSPSLSDLTEQIKKSPKDASLYCRRAEAKLAKERFDEALADAAEALKFDPKSSAAHQVRGMVHAAKKRWDEAIGELNEAIKLDPNNDRAYGERAQAWLRKKDLAKAQADLDKAQALRTAQADALRARFRNLAARPDDKPARK